MEKVIKGSFGMGSARSWEDDVVDKIGVTDTSNIPPKVQKTYRETQRSVTPIFSMSKDEVFADETTGGGHKKRELNKQIWMQFNNVTKNKSQIAKNLGVARQSVYNHLDIYGEM